MKHSRSALLAALLLLCLPLHAQVTKVHIIFKTHLDIGFTDLSSKVEKNYVTNFIPKALEVAEQLRKENGEERYVWTTGSWLIQAYLEQADATQRAQFEQALRRGDIVWNAMPYTMESESLNREQLETLMNLSKQLDKRYGKHTTGAKMTDVPGHTRAIVPILAKAGVQFLHIGVNPASTVPSTPGLCRWRSPEGSEIILMYQEDYGSDTVLPDGHTAVVVAFTGDNHGPHTADRVKAIYADLRKKYPGARLVASTLNDVAADVVKMKDKLPVFTQEIGDTWIYGFGSSPLRMAAFRAMGRMYSRWIAQGKIAPDSNEAVRFMSRLGLIAEHTWGVDVKSHLHNWDKYNIDVFRASRNLPAFRMADASWKELTDNLQQAIGYLPAALKPEAQATLDSIMSPPRPAALKKAKKQPKAGLVSPEGALLLTQGKARMKAGVLAYQTFSQPDYQRFFTHYMTHPYGWAFQDFGKPGLDKSQAKSVLREFHVAACESGSKKGELDLGIATDDSIDARIVPGGVRSSYRVLPKEKAAEWTLTLTDVPANRLPEAYWFSFYPEDITGIEVEKTGQMIDVTDVVKGGNRQMHGIDRCVIVHTRNGSWRISSLDAFLVGVGERNLLNYSTQLPDISGGIHFCLYNNVWGTNFSQWFEGSIRYRFRVEWLG